MDFFESLFTTYLGTTWLVIIVMIIGLIVSARVNSAYKSMRKVNSVNGVPANVVARQILESNGVTNVDIICGGGNAMTNYFDPRNNSITLSEEVFHSSSVGAIGIAAHEVGHAIQHAEGYLPMKIRGALIPIASFGSNAWFLIFLLGVFFSMPILVDVAIYLFAAILIFQLITLPVEYNASARAIYTINQNNILTPVESKGAKKVLNAAAMTYVAAALMSLAQLLRLIAMSKRN